MQKSSIVVVARKSGNTRITVCSVLDYARQGWHRDRIAALFRLSSRDIQAALDYIDQHQDEVTANYQTMRTRQKNYPYTPDIAAKIAVSRQRAQARLAALKSSCLESKKSLQWPASWLTTTLKATSWCCCACGRQMSGVRLGESRYRGRVL